MNFIDFFSVFTINTSLYLFVAFLNLVVPGTTIDGYVTDPNSSLSSPKPLVYKLNGLRVFFIMVLSFIVLSYLNIINGSYFYENFSYGLLSSFIIGIGLSFLYYFWGPFTKPPNKWSCATKITDEHRKYFIYNFFFGYELNPRFKVKIIELFDIKMYCYLIGAIMNELIVLSFIYHQYYNYNHISTPLLIYLFQTSWFLIEYLYFEHVHLYTYDFFDENIGFKLIWGCLFFYPYFYSIGVWSYLTNFPVSYSNLFPLSIILFFFGWTFTRGANYQKYLFKINPKGSFLGIPHETLKGNNRILISGFWSFARHINYLGEIIQSFAMGLSVLATPNGSIPLYITLAFLPCIYYILLLFTRERDDDLRCSLKYGESWKEYQQKVPYRIIPFIY